MLAFTVTFGLTTLIIVILIVVVLYLLMRRHGDNQRGLCR